MPPHPCTSKNLRSPTTFSFGHSSACTSPGGITTTALFGEGVKRRGCLRRLFRPNDSRHLLTSGISLLEGLHLYSHCAPPFHFCHFGLVPSILRDTVPVQRYSPRRSQRVGKR